MTSNGDQVQFPKIGSNREEVEFPKLRANQMAPKRPFQKLQSTIRLPNARPPKNMKSRIASSRNLIQQSNMMEEDIQTKFRQACISNDLESIKLLLASKADVNHKSAAGSTPLMEATNLGHKSVVKKLIKHGADVNAINRQSNTALHFAYEKLHYDIIRQLEAHGAAPSHDIVNAAGHTPRKYMYAKVPLDRKLKIACQHGDLRNAEFFLLQGASVDAATVAGSTALMDAVWYGHSHIINFLLKNGARMDKVTQTGNTALHMAYIRGHKSVVEVLLHHGADPDVKNAQGLTAMDMLYVKGSDDYKFRLACRYGHPRKMALLLKKGANVNAVSHHTGMTGLMEAVWNKHVEAVHLLMKCNANITMRNHKKNNALHLAYQHLDEQIIKILSSSSGFSKALKQKNYLHLTPRQLGKRVKRGGGAQRVYSEALGKAAKHGNAYLVADMIKGVDVNAQSESGKTVLMDAVYQGHLEVSQVLVRAKADVNMTTFQNKTALQFAMERNHMECAAYLKAMGAVLEPEAPEPVRESQESDANNVKINRKKSRLFSIDNKAGFNLKATMMIEEADPLFGDVTAAPARKGLAPLKPLSRDAVLDTYIKSESQINAEREAAEQRVKEQKAKERRNQRQRDGLNKKRKPLWKIKQEQNNNQPLAPVAQPGYASAALTATVDVDKAGDEEAQAAAKAKEDKERRRREKKERKRRRKAAREAQKAVVRKLRKTTLDVVHCAWVLKAAVAHKKMQLAQKKEAEKRESKVLYEQALQTVFHIYAIAQSTLDGTEEHVETKLAPVVEIKELTAEEKAMHESATKIQAMWRGKLDREYAQVKRKMSMHVDSLHVNLLDEHKSDVPEPKRLTFAQQLQLERENFEKQEMALELLHAATDGDADLVQVLLEEGADPNPTDHDGFTPLLLAAYYGDVGSVNILLEHGADINATTPDGANALAAAALTGSAEVVESLLQAAPDMVNATLKDGSTPLLLAAQEGRTEVVEILVKKKADICARNNEDGRTPLLMAVQENHLEAVSYLLSAGADPTLMTTTDPPSAIIEVATTSTMTALLEPFVNGDDTKVDYSPFESFIFAHIKVSNPPTMTVAECSELLVRLVGNQPTKPLPADDQLSFALFCGLCKCFTWKDEIKDELRNWEVQQDCGRMFFYNHITQKSQWEDPFCLKPCEWERMENGGEVFYYNRTTGESVWDQPADYFETAATMPKVNRTEDDDEGDQEWEQVTDYDSVYYVNKLTGETVFEKPKGFGKKKRKSVKTKKQKQTEKPNKHHRRKSQLLAGVMFLNTHAHGVLDDVGSDGDTDDEEEWAPREEWGELFYENTLTGAIKWPQPLPSTWREYEEKGVTYYGDEETGAGWALKFTEHKRPFFRNVANGVCRFSAPWVASKTKTPAPWAIMWIKKLLLSD